MCVCVCLCVHKEESSSQGTCVSRPLSLSLSLSRPLCPSDLCASAPHVTGQKHCPSLSHCLLPALIGRRPAKAPLKNSSRRSTTKPRALSLFSPSLSFVLSFLSSPSPALSLRHSLVSSALSLVFPFSLPAPQCLSDISFSAFWPSLGSASAGFTCAALLVLRL